MNTQKKYVVFFDLDKTLLSVNSGKILVQMAYKTGLMPFRTYLKAISTSIVYKFNLRKPIVAVNNMASWLAGFEEKLFTEFINTIIENHLIKSIRPSMVKEIELHKKQGGYIVLLSASLPQVCQPIAKHLGIDEIICSEMEIKNGIFTGYPKGNICLGPEKEIRIKKFCEVNSFILNESYSYADSISDIEVQTATGHPVCVSPDKKLRRIAENKGWRIIEE